MKGFTLNSKLSCRLPVTIMGTRYKDGGCEIHAVLHDGLNMIEAISGAEFQYIKDEAEYSKELLVCC